MNILFKYIWKSMLEKKGRFALLLIAISISTGLFIGSQKATTTAIESNTKTTLATLEKRTIGITNKEVGNELKLADLDTDLFKNAVSEISLNNVKLKKNIKEVTISLKGRKPADFPKDLAFIKGSKEAITNQQVIISERISKELNLKPGSQLYLRINDQELQLSVKGIVKNNGLFYNDVKHHFVVLMDQASLARLTDLNVNIITAEPKSVETVNNTLKKFNKNNKSMVAVNLVDDEQLKMITTQVTSIFLFMFLFVALMSVLIISGAFKLIIMERLKIMGTFLSQGATWWQIRFIFLLESVSYGLLGGSIGLVIGYGIDFLVNYMASPLKEYGIYDKPSISIETLVMGYTFAIFLSVVSVLAPLIKLRHLSDKEVILHEPTYENDAGWLKIGIGALFMIVTVIFTYNTVSLIWTLVAVVTGFIGFVLIYPKLVEWSLTRAFQWLKNKSSMLALACQNVGTSKMIRSNITLTTIAVIVLIMINSIGVSLRSVLTEAYKGYKFDVSIEVPYSGVENQKEELQKKVETDMVIKKDSKIQHSEIMTTTRIKDVTTNLVAVDNVSHYRNYFDYLDWHQVDFDQPFAELVKKENTFFSTKSYAKALKLKKGDKVEFDFGTEKKEFTLVGIYDNKTGFNSLLTLAGNLPEAVRLTAPTTYFYETTTGAKKAK